MSHALAVREFLDRFMNQHAARRWAERLATEPEGQAMLVAEIVAVAVELAGLDPTPLERNLAESAALAWFVERQYQASVAEARTGKGPPMSMEQVKYLEHRLDRASRRYLQTMKTLATVRRLALPVLKLRLAARQLEVDLPSATLVGDGPGGHAAQLPANGPEAEPGHA